MVDPHVTWFSKLLSIQLRFINNAIVYAYTLTIFHTSDKSGGVVERGVEYLSGVVKRDVLGVWLLITLFFFICMHQSLIPLMTSRWIT